MICRLENKNRNKNTHKKNTLVVKEKGPLEIALLIWYISTQLPKSILYIA